MIWFIIMTIVMNNGDVYTEVHPANTPEFNNKESCMMAGQSLTDEKQVKIGTDSGKVYYICDSLDENTINKALGKSKS